MAKGQSVGCYVGVRGERMVIQRRRDTSLDQALRAMVEQYGRSLSEKAQQGIVDIVRRLEAEGKIQVASGAADDVLV